MSEKKFHEWISSEFEKEADDLERRLKEREAANPELAAMKMPDDSFDDLMRRIEAGKKAETDDLEKETGTDHVVSLEEHPASGRKSFRMQKRVLLAVAAAAVLVVATGVGATGAKLFVPKVENSGEDGEFNTTIINGEMEEDRDVTEEEAYEEIEDKIGIQALRLSNKPQDMILESVYIDEAMGEVQMQFQINEKTFIIYENKQMDNAAFDKKIDGEVVDDIDSFYLNKTIEILQIDKGNGTYSYASYFEQGNAYYSIISDLKLEEFEQIIAEIYFKSV
ncbi:Uncharacterised protein [uncultured Clostridium sp.]|nr:Uncharacterised protein [uncultured Clostridium sp.]